MKTLLLILAISMLQISCAHTTAAPIKVVPAAIADPASTTPMSPRPVRTYEAKVSCPRNLQTVKGQNWKVAVKMANACVQQAQWGVVESIGGWLAENESRSPWGAYYLSLAAEARNEMSRATWMIELALKKSPKNSLIQYQRGRLLWLLGQRTEALQELKIASDNDSRLVDANVLLGQISFEEADFKTAANYFQKVLSIESTNLNALLGMAEISILKKDYKATGEFLLTAVSQHPSHAQARVRQADFYENMEKNISEALNAYKKLKILDKEKRLDSVVEVDLEAKIQQLEVAVREQNAKQLSLRDPAEEKKVKK